MENMDVILVEDVAVSFVIWETVYIQELISLKLFAVW